MTWVDTTVLLVVIISAIVAFARGFVAEVLGILAWIGAAAIASAFGYLAKPTFRGWVNNPDIADPAAYAAVFLISLVVLSIFTGMIGGAVRASILGGLDRTLGIVFGLLRGIAIVAAVYAGSTYVFPAERWPESVVQARSLPHIYAVASWLATLLPADFRPHVPRPPEPRPASAAEYLQATPQGRATARP